MSTRPHSKAAKAAFVPGIEGDAGPPRHGRRRGVPVTAGEPVRWPTTPKERFKQFDHWRHIAMQVVHKAGISFRLMGVLRSFVHWESGELWPTNAQLAKAAGNCGQSTVRRDLAAYQALGLLIVETDPPRLCGERFARKRTIRLAFPEGFNGNLDDPPDMLTRGARTKSGDMLTRGPDPMLTRGPSTLEYTLEGHPSFDISEDRNDEP